MDQLNFSTYLTGFIACFVLNVSVVGLTACVAPDLGLDKDCVLFDFKQGRNLEGKHVVCYVKSLKSIISLCFLNLFSKNRYAAKHLHFKDQWCLDLRGE